MFKKKTTNNYQTKLESARKLLKNYKEVPLKRMDGLSATETEGGRASEMDRRKSAKSLEMPLKQIKCNNTF